MTTENTGDTEKAQTATEESPEQKALNLAKEWENKYLYLYAEFDNFRKRMQRERLDFIKFGHEGFLRDLLLVQDNFDRALAHARQTTEISKVIEGLEMVRNMFWEYLKSQGISEVKTVGEKFDPSIHHAIGEEGVANSEPGTILKEELKGYRLHDRLLRAAKVIVAKKTE